MGYVHHANYFVYFELGRTEMLRTTGLNYRDLEKRGYHLVVVKAACRYKAPARYDDELIVRTRIERATKVRIDHSYQLMRDGQILAEG
jgi:acyl-CoA thioester hydrolase